MEGQVLSAVDLVSPCIVTSKSWGYFHWCMTDRTAHPWIPGPSTYSHMLICNICTELMTQRKWEWSHKRKRGTNSYVYNCIMLNNENSAKLTIIQRKRMIFKQISMIKYLVLLLFLSDSGKLGCSGCITGCSRKGKENARQSWRKKKASSDIHWFGNCEIVLQ